MSDFERLTEAARAGDGRFEWTVPEGWQQGRGAFGGLVIAAMARAAEAHVGAPDRTLRSITAELPAATLPGAAELHAETLRAGSGQSTVAVRLVQDGEVRAHAVAVLARARGAADAEHDEVVAPALRPWRETAEVPMGSLGPTFSKAFEYRTDGPFPFSSGPSARAEGWIAMRAPGARRDGAWLAAMADAWWPAIFSRWAGPRPMGTVAFTMQVVGSCEGLDPEAPLAYRAHAPISREGWVVELRELFGHDGRLLALNQQTFAIIK